MHLRIQTDNISKAAPAITMLAMSLFVAGMYFTRVVQRILNLGGKESEMENF